MKWFKFDDEDVTQIESLTPSKDELAERMEIEKISAAARKAALVKKKLKRKVVLDDDL